MASVRTARERKHDNADGEFMKKLIVLILFFCISAQGAFSQTDVRSGKITERLLAHARDIQSKRLTKQTENSEVRVLFYPAGQKSSNVDLSFFKKHNIEYVKSKSYISAKIDASLVPELENVSGVEKIDISFPAQLLYIGQGASLINASQYDGGYGVKIAIIDVKEPGGGFKGYKNLQARGELPKTVKTKDFTRPGNPPIEDAHEMGNHGSACAEIVYDIAPGADMYLLEIDEIPSFENAYDYCISEGIKVTSVSLGWTSKLLPYSHVGYGVSEVAVIVESATLQGVLSVVAAGNEGPSAGSLSSPGDARSALTVGAVDYRNYSSGPVERFSSRGPVYAYSGGGVDLSSATKPEIVAPDGISSVSYGESFYGTSAATPHAAGAAALLLSFFQNLNTPQTLKNEIITKYAKPIGAEVLPNDSYGYGRLVLDDNLVPVLNTGNIIVYPNPVSISKKGSVRIANIPINTRIYGVNIFTVTGQFVRSLDFVEAGYDFINGETRKFLSWDLKNQSGSQVAPGVYFAVIDTFAHGKIVKKIALQK
jgi:hypothetical protein